MSNRPLVHELPPGCNERVEVDIDGQMFEIDPGAQRFELESNHPLGHELFDNNRAVELASPSQNARSDSSQSIGKASSENVSPAEKPRPKSSLFLFGKKVSNYWTVGT
jgi:hypothetical protein